jgi:hypothetical protein
VVGNAIQAMARQPEAGPYRVRALLHRLGSRKS